MFSYLYKRELHTDTSVEYMTALGIDEETQESILQQEKYELEKAKRDVRAKRDRLIAETDYFMLSDAPTPPAGLEQYRQDLRDITEQSGFPYDVIWPEKPQEQ